MENILLNHLGTFLIGFVWGWTAYVFVEKSEEFLDKWYIKILSIIFTPILLIIVGLYIIGFLCFYKLTDLPIVFVFRVRFLNYRINKNFSPKQIQFVRQKFQVYIQNRQESSLISNKTIIKYFDIYLMNKDNKEPQILFPLIVIMGVMLSVSIAIKFFLVDLKLILK